ncbi:MAG: queuosine precursor transporter [Sphingomonadales bacterium]|nr:queuosine precursor transporter [Sphingomonadales bacterium]
MENNVNQHPKFQKLFLLLGFLFLTNAIIAEIIGTKIFSLEGSLGIPPANISLGGETFSFNLTAGVMLWPVVFVLTDIINEYYGRKGVKKLSYLAAGMLVYSFLMILGAMNLEGADFWIKSKQGQGIPEMDTAFNAILGQGLFIIIGSLIAFLIGQMVDAFVFTQVKKRTGNNMIWLRATGSTLISQFIDSYVVLFIAFYWGADWSAVTVLKIGTINYIYKLGVAILLTPVLYGVHAGIDRFLGKELSQNMMKTAMESS